MITTLPLCRLRDVLTNAGLEPKCRARETLNNNGNDLSQANHDLGLELSGTIASLRSRTSLRLGVRGSEIVWGYFTLSVALRQHLSARASRPHEAASPRCAPNNPKAPESFIRATRSMRAGRPRSQDSRPRPCGPKTHAETFSANVARAGNRPAQRDYGDWKRQRGHTKLSHLRCSIQ
jgi:hypothetical protein